MTADLPRLAVVTDVPVARTSSGAILLHRLLAGYPRDRLRVVQSNVHYWPTDTQRLPNVEYRRVSFQVSRLLRNRFNPIWPAIASQVLQGSVLECERAVADFAAEAILTVSHDYLWLAADLMARRSRLPLHLICHDDWPTMATTCQGALRRLALMAGRWTFGRVYRRASSRLCVSPGMLERYRDLYRVDGTVLYPSCGDDSPPPVVRVKMVPPVPPVAAYFGGFNSEGAKDLCRTLAGILENLSGRLDMYPGGDSGVIGPAVRSCGFRPPTELAEVLPVTAHFLFLPGSFRPEEQEHLTTLFPSKLADYTAIGLPVLIWAPSSNSAARWGRENPDAAVTITQNDPAAVRAAILKFTEDTGFSYKVASAGLAAGIRDFALKSARQILYKALTQSCQPHLSAP